MATNPNESVVNIAAYKFIDLDDPEHWRVQIRRLCLQQEILGTVLLGHEGINLMLAGKEAAIQALASFFAGTKEFSDIVFKRSYSDTAPFKRLVVKIKDEIIRMDEKTINPVQHTAPHLAPDTFQQWLDAGKDMVVLDTRNRYEVEVGTLRNAKHLDIDDFRSFPAAAENLPKNYKDKPIVTFCTGGIRCEKAAEYLIQQGFNEVYQLDGGVLNYFQACQGKDWQGECFVFDNRVSLTTDLKESNNHKHLLGQSKYLI